jgi:protease YdgD
LSKILSGHARFRVIVILAFILGGGQPVWSQDSPLSARPAGILGSHDHRVLVESDDWPWSSIGRLNVLMGVSRGYCTGTLIGPRQVLTAAHCLFNTKANTWVEPHNVHFVAGQSRDHFHAHAIADHFVIAPGFDFHVENRPRWDEVDSKMLAKDWAIITLAESMPLRPVPWRHVTDAWEPIGADDEVVRAGYSADRPYILSMHKGCSIAFGPEPGQINHRCDSMPGDSGSPLLWFHAGLVSIIAIHTAVAQKYKPGEGYRAQQGLGVSASSFDKAANAAVGLQP